MYSRALRSVGVQGVIHALSVDCIMRSPDEMLDCLIPLHQDTSLGYCGLEDTPVGH